ncbi:protein disulfide isomerase, putative [Eimeria maxima]|uniref:Protein disulfide isomerase, putative n=1 Tax=Eimeria maxima TaxID=5804 RepID=U6M897_EIMMA|nr:protein disulfide isomerase, putative [Eimeria maxima]CDJ58684.1 protein disulfide isomerase, putative [Eimeria maxima]
MADWGEKFVVIQSPRASSQPIAFTWVKHVLGVRLSLVCLLLIASSLSWHSICVCAASEPTSVSNASLLSKTKPITAAFTGLSKTGEAGEGGNSVLEPAFKADTQIYKASLGKQALTDSPKVNIEEPNVVSEEESIGDQMPVQQRPSLAVFTTSANTNISLTVATLAVYTNEGCPYSQEALREAQVAQTIVRKHGGTINIRHVDMTKEKELGRLLAIKAMPCLRFYRNSDIRSTTYIAYEGVDMTADEIAYWILQQLGKTIQIAPIGQETFRVAAVKGSTVGPVVHASVHEGSPRAALVTWLSTNREQLPSKSTLFNIKYVDLSQQEQFRVYRKRLPFDVGEEEYLTLEEPQWEPKSILALMLAAENRKVFYGDRPSRILLGKRALLSVYVSHHENLQDIALLLMEFYETYRERLAFHIAKGTLKEAARSQDTFSHSWGGAVIIDQQANPAAYQKVTGVLREHSPFSQYSLSMPFNYHSIQLFLKQWSTGNSELHFRSNRLSYTEKESHVTELNHFHFLKTLLQPNRALLAVLYYEPDCSDCQVYLQVWKEASELFKTAEHLKSQVIFGQLDGSLNDIVDFDIKKRIPSIVVYPEGPKALDRRLLYTGSPIVTDILGFLSTLAAKRDEL